ncbi:MAG: tRNA (guanosine(37)-N1)-methyltransferase TrmD [bacterium]
MKITILTIFPEFFDSPLKQSLLGKAADHGPLQVELVDIRDFSTDKHNTVDDAPFGGGTGMVMKVEPLAAALRKVVGEQPEPRRKVLLTSPAGRRFEQSLATQYSLVDHLVIICGRYKGVDARLLQLFDIEEVSLGDFVLNGGEVAALAIIESVFRLLPGGIGKIDSALTDSFSDYLLGPQVWTRPAEYEGLSVPEVMLGGNHARQELYRRWSSLQQTMSVRPDLLKRAELVDEDRRMLGQLAGGMNFEDCY